MRRSTGFKTYLPPLLISALFLALSEPIAAQKTPNPGTRTNPGIGTPQPHMYTVSGSVSDLDSHNRIDNVRVDLRAFTGGTVATVFTSGNGNFTFSNVASGTYQMVVDQTGYQPYMQEVDIEGPVYGLTIELRSKPVASNTVHGPATVSQRELSIPQKAHDSMQKGLELLYKKSDYPGSIKQFERAAQAFPDYYEAYTRMGVAYLHMNNTADAEQSFRKSVDLSKEKYADAFFWLASMRSDQQKFADAEPLARKSVELDSNSWQANSELARALIGLNRPEEAEKSAQAALKLRPDNALLYLILANVHTELQNSQALLDDLNNYLKLAPNGQFAEQVRKQQKELQQTQGDAHAGSAAPTPPNP
jgi:Carboxypeptidase regulatory-like domain/Tetratricopeptide repeat